MRRQLTLATVVVVALVTLAFAIPLGAVVRTVARDRALAGAERDLAALAPVLALTEDPQLVESAVPRPSTGRARTFPSAGPFAYICEFHPEMRGTDVVGSGGGTTPPPSGSSGGSSSAAPSGSTSSRTSSPSRTAASSSTVLAGFIGGAFIFGATGALLYGSSRMLEAEM